MHVIKKIEVCDDKYQCSSLVKFLDCGILEAREAMVDVAKQYIKDMYGQVTLNDARVIEVKNVGEIQEPQESGMYIYKPSETPAIVHLFSKKEVFTLQEGWFINSRVATTSFQRVHIYELEEAVGMEARVKDVDDAVEMVQVVGKTKIPKAMTMFPHAEITNEIRSHPRFLQISEICKDCVCEN